MLIAALLTAALAAAADFKCATDLECELTGSCDAATGRCACFPGWTGPTCGTLDLLPGRRQGAWPAQRAEPPDYWGDGATPAAWGAHINKADDGRYHVISASGCYIPARIMHMDGWQLVHGVGDSPEGPFSFVSTVDGVPASAYNPHTARLPDGRYLLYWGGAKTKPTPKGYAATCTGNETAPPQQVPPASEEQPAAGCTIDDCFNQLCQPQSGNNNSACIDVGCVLDPGFGECYPPAWNTSASIHIRISHSLDGPWENETEVRIGGMSNILKIAAEAADNPSP